MSFSDYFLYQEWERRSLSAIYLARDQRTGQRVFLEVFREPKMGHNGHLCQRLEALAALRHTHLLPVLEMGHQGSGLYLVWPRFEGETLTDRLAATTQAGPQEAAQWARELAGAVQHANEHGIFRCLQGPNQVTLLATGSALRISPESEVRFVYPPVPCQHADAQPWAIGWMAPELASRRAGSELGPALDVWGLGVFLFSLLAARPPFQRGSPLDTLIAVFTEPAPSLTEMRPDAGADLALIVARCLEKKPEDRYPDVQALVLDLEHFLARRPIERPAAPSVLLRVRSWLRRQLGG